MAKPRATTLKKSKDSASAGLIEALKFVSLAQKKEGLSYQTHCIVGNNKIVAFDGVLTAGCTITEDLQACVSTFKFIDALERCNKSVSITQMDAGRLSVKSGAFSVFIPCYGEDMPLLVPDAPITAIDDRLKTGFDAIAFLSDDKLEKIVLSSILLRSGSMLSTDGACLLEYWHGIDLPQVILPTTFVSAIMKCSKKLVQFGYSAASVTFWYDDNSWIKTQVYDESWPSIDVILNKPCNSQPLNKSFFEGLLSIEAFADGKQKSKVVYFYDNELRTSRTEGEGATYEVKGIPFGPAFNIDKLKRIQHCVETVDWTSHNAAYFFGKDVRGCIMGVSK